MKTFTVKSPTCRTFLTLLLVFTTFYFANPITALAEHGAYSLVGSTGSVDEAGLAIYEIRNQAASIKMGAGNLGTATYRYNLPPAGAGNWLADDDGCPCFEQIRIRYRDNGVGARVVVRLREANLEGDGVATLYTFDSDAATDSEGTAIPANAAFNRTFDSVGHAYPFDFSQKEYWFEVDITKTDATFDGVLVGIAIGDAFV